MRKKGFSYIEVMIAISIFALLLIMVMKINSTSQSNLNKQINSQKMMFVAQEQMEKYKSSQLKVVETQDFILIDEYYVKLTIDNTPGGNIYRVTVTVRSVPTDGSGEIILQSHILKD